MGYVIERKSHSKSLGKLSTNGTGFVCCLVDAGSNCGVINDNLFSLNRNNKMSSLIMFGPIFYTQQVYKNYQKETARIHTLAQKLEGQQIVQTSELDKFKSTLSDLRQYRDSLENSQVEETTMGKDNGKRLALNNGIFKPDNQNLWY